MKKILIVDDQTLNQTLLEAYVRQYFEEIGESVEIQTANNGIEAVVLSQDKPFDIIFMDIIMPTMDGIEATKHINALLPEAIIVIVSTEGDEVNQIKALRNGAKDYCVKPIQSDVFKHRLKLYLTMLGSAKNIPSSKQAINLFTNTVFCYKTTYLIENEEDLTQVWESLLMTIKDSVRTNLLSDIIRFIYQLGLLILTRKVQPEIIIEENEHSYFFTILNVKIISSAKITELIEDYFDHIDYKLRTNLLSFKISKEALPSLDVTTPVIPTKNSESPISVIYEKHSEALQTFDFMEDDDLNSLELKLNELSTQFLWMGSNELNMDDVDQIVTAFDRTSSILNFYPETHLLGTSIHELTVIIKEDEEKFIELASQMSSLCKSFNNDLILWVKNVFYEGAPSVGFMNASILSNIQMIQSFLEPEKESSGNEDGFEFF